MAVPETIGQYEVLEEIGRGATGVVFLARQPSVNRLVVIKVLSNADSELSERLGRVVSVLRELEHPNIVSVLDVGEVDGSPYYAMAYCAGGNLTKVLDRDGTLSAGQTSSVVSAVSEALAALHARGITHGDIKPSNVLLSGDGNVLLSDFGLAPTGDSSSAANDVYSLGALAYQCLSGESPSSGAQVGRHLGAAAPNTPPALVALVERAMAQDASARPEGLSQFAQALRSAAPPAPIVPVAPTLDDSITIRRATAGLGRAGREVSVASLASASETARSGTQTSRWRRPPVLAAIAAPVVIAILVGLLVSRGSNAPRRSISVENRAALLTHAFDSVVYNNGVVLARSWAVSRDGGEVDATLTATNPTGRRVTQDVDVVVTKSLASSVDQIHFDAPYDSVVQRDPIVRYRWTLGPHSSKSVHYSVKPGRLVDAPMLTRWAADQARDEAAYAGQKIGRPKALKLSISISPNELVLNMGSTPTGQLTLSGRTSDGKSAPPGSLAGVAWTSSSPPIAVVSATGEVFAAFPGTATITARIGTASATATVIVTAPQDTAGGLAAGTAVRPTRSDSRSTVPTANIGPLSNTATTRPASTSTTKPRTTTTKPKPATTTTKPKESTTTTKPKAPPKVVKASKGPPHIGSTCSSPTCRWLSFSVSGFPANKTYSITCHSDHAGDRSWGPYTGFTTNDSGSGSWPTGGCLFGWTGYHAWLTIGGVNSTRVAF